jgi:restriction system protein
MLLGLLWLIVYGFEKASPAMFFLLAGGLSVFGMLFYMTRSKLLKKLSDAAARHEKSLVASFRQTVREDQFGNVDESKWRKVVDVFLSTQVAPKNVNYSHWKEKSVGRYAVKWLDRFVRDKAMIASKVIGYVDSASLTPAEYEEHCVNVIQKLGWSARLTKASRDHGADVIAEKGDQRLVIQCKRYAKPVGNKAVQEVNAARSLYHGTAACVIAPAGFTSQAQREAHGLKIHLRHHSDLENLIYHLEQNSQPS